MGTGRTEGPPAEDGSKAGRPAGNREARAAGSCAGVGRRGAGPRKGEEGSDGVGGGGARLWTAQKSGQGRHCGLECRKLTWEESDSSPPTPLPSSVPSFPTPWAAPSWAPPRSWSGVGPASCAQWLKLLLPPPPRWCGGGDTRDFIEVCVCGGGGGGGGVAFSED